MAFDTPILLLIFNRPGTTEKVFQQIRIMQPKRLFIGADGPRPGRVDDIEKCQQTRDICINNIDWDCEVKTLFRDHNHGCDPAIRQAISWFFDQVEEGLIFEDDVFVNRSFFYFCQEMLKRYRDDVEVMHINGANSIFPFMRIKDPYYFSKLPSGWGWATWARAWKNYNHVCDLDEDLVKVEIKKWIGSKKISNFFYDIFDRLKRREIDNWDYQWTFSLFAAGGLTITPSVNFVLNLGFNEDATHTSGSAGEAYKHMQLQEIEMPIAGVEKKLLREADRFGMKRYLGLTKNIFSRVFKFARRQLQYKN